MEKINLNFFGEEVTIENPKDLAMLRKNISEKYSLSASDAAEIILFYVKDSKKIYIINENDFNNFKQFKISTIFLDVNQNSKLYLDSASQLKNEKEEVVDIENTKKEIEELKAKSEEILQKQREKRKLYEDKRYEISLQKRELEIMDEELNLECAVDMEEFSDKRNEINKRIEELKEKIKPKNEEIILKAPQPKKNTFRGGPSGQNNFPYNISALRKNEEAWKKFYEKVKVLKEKRVAERKALEEKKLLEAKNEILLKNMKNNMPDAIPIFAKVNEVLNKTVLKVKELAREKVMTKEEKEISKKEEDLKKEKEKHKKEQTEKIQKITRDAVNEINNLTKLVIEQSNSLIERINNPELYKSQSSDDILLRAAPKIVKKEKPEIHYNVICDGCKVTPLRGNRYFQVIAHPFCRNRLGHPNTKYCQRGIVHSNVMCDGCGMLPIKGWRYKCSICDDYNLCENCEEKSGHNHPFLKITYSSLLNKFNENYIKLNTYEAK